MKMMLKMIFYSLIPLAIFGVIAFLLSNAIISSVISNSIESGLSAAVVSLSDTLDNADEGAYGLDSYGKLVKGDFNISEHVELVDNIKTASNMDITIFYGQQRYLTSVLNNEGERIIGTRANDKIIEKVMTNGENYFATDIEVVGQSFYGYYAPLKDTATGKTVGMLFAGMPKAQAQAQINIIRAIIIAMLVVCAAIFCFIIGKMVLGLSKCVNTLDSVAKGQLNNEIDQKLLKQKDEIGVMAKAVMKLQEDFVIIISAMKKQSGQLVDTSDYLQEKTNKTENHVRQVERAVDDITMGAGSQAEETQNATENIILMGNMIGETAGEIEGLTQNAESIKNRGQIAEDALKELQDINEKAKESINIIYDQTNTTNDSAQKIREATGIISEIADETNLLSLNASIEAARAGEQGRGFAVVAAQIQKLAEQSNESARQIESIILSLIDDSEKAVNTMNEVTEIMDQQSRQVLDTDAQVSAVLEEVEQAITAIGTVAEKMEKINETRGSVVDIVQNLSAIAQENAASTQETAASVTEVSNIIGDIAENAKNLRTISEHMESSMAKFQIR